MMIRNDNRPLLKGQAQQRVAVRYLIVSILLMITLSCASTLAATPPDWCAALSGEQVKSAFGLCDPSLSTTRPSWCTYNNFRASQPITFRDPDIFNCDATGAQCLYTKITDKTPITSTENNMICVKDQDVDNIVKIYKEDYSGGNVTTTDQSSQSENNRCFFVRAAKPLEMSADGAKQYLLVLTNRHLLVLDMTTEQLAYSYQVLDAKTALTDKPSKMAVYRTSSTEATIYVTLSTQTLLVLKLDTTGTLTVSSSKTIALTTDTATKLSSSEFVQDLQTIAYIDTLGTATHMAVLSYGTSTSTNGIIIYKGSTLYKWAFADQTEERKIFGFAHGQFGTNPTYSSKVDCNSVKASRPLLLIQSKSQVNLIQLVGKPNDSPVDLTKKTSIIYTHGVSGESIYSVSAFTECYGTLAKTSQSVWVAVGVASTTASANAFGPRLFVFNLPEMASQDVTDISSDPAGIYKAVGIPADTTCSTSYTSTTKPQYSKSGTCTNRPNKESDLKTTSAVPSKMVIGMYKTSDTAITDAYSTFYHTINIATRESIEVFSFQEYACTDTSASTSSSSLFTLQQTALLNSDGKINDIYVSENAQHIFAVLSRKAFDIDARIRLQDICTLLASSNPPSSLTKFTEACKKYPTKYTAFDFIGYFSMCNGGWTCPRYGDSGKLSEGYANTVSISAGYHTIRPTMVFKCEPGFYCPTNNEGRRRPCPVGFKCKDSAMTAPTACSPSSTFETTCGIEGSSTEQRCPDGQICLNPLMSIPVPPGYLARKTRSQLYTCRNGQYCPLATQGLDTTGATLVNACPALNYCETPYSMTPTPCLEQIGNRTQYCPTGTYGSDEHYCPEGYYCPTLSSKVLCEDGYYCPRGTKEPLACTAGYYCPNTNSMLLCPSGYHCAAGSTYPKRCQWFSYCPEGSAKQQSFYLGILLMFVVVFLVLVTFVVVRCVTASYKKKKMKQKKIKQDQEISGQNGLANIGINIANFIQGNEQFNYDSTGSLVNEPPFSKKNFTIDYAFEDLSYIRKKSEEVIFEGVTGRVYHGRTTCIIGVDSEATSALLNTLSGRHHLGFVHGKIMINEQIKDPHEFRNIISFAPKQLDMAKELKVHELLRFAGHSRLPSYYTYSQVGRRVEKTCKVLGIENFMYDTIGKSKKHGLDEELRVFVNMALEMVADPVCLFVDNPFDEIPLERKKFLCKAFKLAAESGTTVVSTMLRPRNDVFLLFDDCIIMGKNGGIVYNGPTKDALRFFEEIGFKCPNYENPPDFFVDVCLGNVERPGDPNFEPERLLHLWDLKKEENEKKWLKSRNGNETQQSEQEQEDDEEVGASVIDPQQVLLGSEVAKERQRKPIAFLGQYLLFSLRALLQLSRHYKGVFFDFFFHFALAVIIGGFYFNMDFIGPLSSTLQKLCPTFISNQCSLPRIDKIAPMSIVTVSALAIAAMQSSLKCFGADKELYRREAQNGINKMSYFLGKLTGEIPSLLIYPLVFVTFWYILVNPEAEFYTYYGLFLLFEIVFSSLGYFISVFVQRTHAEFVGVMYIILCALLGGVQPTVRTMSKEWYTLVLVCSSPVRWAVELMYTVEIRKYQESNQNVATALENYGFSYKAYYISPIILIAITIIFLVLSFVGLVMRDPQAVERIKTLTRVYIRKGKRKLKKLKSERKKPGDYVFQQESEIQVLEDGEESESDEDDELLLQQDEVYQPPSMQQDQQ